MKTNPLVREVPYMYAGWMIVGAFLAVMASIIVWTLILTSVVTWIEGHHSHGPSRPTRLRKG